MPSTYAHRRFGADVLVQLPRELREKITPYRPLYDMGLHGPDLMFYYRALQSNPVNRLGNAMHEQPGRVFFTRARGVVNTARNKMLRWPMRWGSSATLHWTAPATPMWSATPGKAV